MKYTGRKDVLGNRIFVDDTVFSPEFGQYVVRYRLDLGGMVVCETSGSSAADVRDEDYRDIDFLAGKNFTRVGGKDATVAEIDARIIALIAKKPG